MACACATTVGCCCITTSCCPGKNFKRTLYAVIPSGPCAGTYPLVFDDTFCGWQTFATVGLCPTGDPTKPSIAVICSPPDCMFWHLLIDGALIAGEIVVVSCDPLILTATPDELNVDCGCGDPTPITIVETP